MPDSKSPVIEWRFPGPDEAGYLRRRRELTMLLEAPATSQAVDAQVEYALAYIVKPEDREAARAALLEMSTIEFHAAILQLMGFRTAKPPGRLEDKSAAGAEGGSQDG